MIKVIVAYDGMNERLGDYFTLCKDDVVRSLGNDQGIILEIIPPSMLNRTYIEIKYVDLKEESFIFLGFMHGNTNSIDSANGVVVQSSYLSEIFKKSLFITNSCNSAVELGPALIQGQCHAFIGYDTEIGIYSASALTEFLKCDNHVLFAFLLEGLSLEEAFGRSKVYFTQQARRFRELGDTLGASLLVTARESLKLLGNGNLVRTDLLH